MQNIEKHIIDLFRKHDCVIIPDFGGFLLSNKPARFNATGDELLPPGRVVSFNRSLVSNDGLLASLIASRENVTYSDAVSTLADKVRVWKEQLDNQKEVRLDDVGVISQGSEGKWQFQPASTRNFLSSSFGLVPVQIRQEEIIETKESGGGIYALKPMKSPKLPVYLAVAASIVLLIGISGVLFKTVFHKNNDLAGISSEVFNSKDQPGSSAESKKESALVAETKPEIKSETTTSENKTTTESLIKTSVENVKAENTPEEHKSVVVAEPAKKAVVKAPMKHLKHSYIAPVEKVEINTAPQSGFYVIVGCFTLKSNAVRFVGSLRKKGQTPELLHNNESMFRVSYKMDSDSLNADSILKNVRTDGNESAWLLHLK